MNTPETTEEQVKGWVAKAKAQLEPLGVKYFSVYEGHGSGVTFYASTGFDSVDAESLAELIARASLIDPATVKQRELAEAKARVAELEAELSTQC